MVLLVGILLAEVCLQVCNHCEFESCGLLRQTMKAFLDSVKNAKTEFFEYEGQNHGFLNSADKDIKDKMASTIPSTLLLLLALVCLDLRP